MALRRILDASAFYAGIPFAASGEFYTTSLVFDEIDHIKKSHDALGILTQTGRLKIRDPEPEFTERITQEAIKSGDIHELSKQDISILALCLEMHGEIITDDYAVSNIASILHIKVSPVMTGGIKKVGRWIYYCAGCNVEFTKASKCNRCGNPLQKKFIKK